jgi:putative serine protease PepD
VSTNEPDPRGGPPRYAPPPPPYGAPEQNQPLPMGPGSGPPYYPPGQYPPIRPPFPPAQISPPRPAGSRGTPWAKLAVFTVVIGLLAGAGGAALVHVVNRSDSDGGSTTTPQGQRGSAVSVARTILPSVVSIQLTASTATITGSGFVWDNLGDIVTNNHVVHDASNGAVMEVTLANGDHRSARLVGRSAAYDVAVIKIADARGLKPVKVGRSERVQVGQTVVAVGSPLGLKQTVTEGIVSAVNRPVTVGGAGETAYLNALQTDAAINPGNSGGPLVDLDARVVGVNSAIASVGQQSSGSDQAGSIGVGFAIPVNQVATTVRQLIDNGRAVYPIIGAEVKIDTTTDGARVTNVDAGSPAQRAGLRSDDVIHAVDGARISDGIGLIVTIRSHHPGDRIAVTYERGGKTSKTQITLGSRVG